MVKQYFDEGDSFVDKCINAMWRESMAKGRAEGLARGRAEGKAEESSKVIKNMINLGFPDDIISNIVERHVSEIVAIRSSMM